MVLNDIGPHIPEAALKRIRAYMTTSPERFPTMAALEAHLRNIHAPFGQLTDRQWAHLAKFSARPVLDLAGSTFALHYDPKITEPIRDTVPLDVDMWPFWDLIKLPVLAIRGETSDLLTEDTFGRMKAEGAETLIVPSAGHAPALMDETSIAAVREFLAG
jgi:pimeloyl-ACP methyl ester carboxylesterase